MSESRRPWVNSASVVRVYIVAIVKFTRALLAQSGEFRRQPPSPATTWDFETRLAGLLRDLGLAVLSVTDNALEPTDQAAVPARLFWAGETYRRRAQSPNVIATLFGSLSLQRWWYECLEPGEPGIAPLELALGVEAKLATPALAERIGRWTADHEQAQVLRLLAEEHGVSWSVASLRKLTAALHQGLAGFRQAAQVQHLLDAMQVAKRSAGTHPLTLSVGRDGVMVPIRKMGYKEAATATVSVIDRAGRRATTVYLGQMPEAGQHQLTAELTALLTALLAAWHAAGGQRPRLVYVTDGGQHPHAYYGNVLRRLPDPWQPGTTLSWRWVLDFYHACQHLWDLAEALFGPGQRAVAWFTKMRHRLRHERRGILNLLRSATQHRNRLKLNARRDADYQTAYCYLRKHVPFMHYATCKAQGLPIGSGVTEAACKTVFAQRLKRSGMTWTIPGGTIVIGLRVLVLSQVWPSVYQAHLHDYQPPKTRSSQVFTAHTCPIAA